MPTDDPTWAKDERAAALREAMLHAAWAAVAAWRRYLEAPTASQQRGLDLLLAYRWAQRHLRLANPRLHVRYGGLLSEHDRLPVATVAAIERRVSGIADEVLKLDSLSGADSLEQLRKALQMEGRGRGPKETRANALSRSMGRHAADVIDRLVRGQQRYLAGTGRLPQRPTVEDRLHLVASAHDVSIHTVRRAWAATRSAAPELQRLHEVAISNQREIRRHARTEVDPHAVSVVAKKLPNRRQFKAGINRDLKRK